MTALINNFRFIKDTKVTPPNLIQFTEIDNFKIYIQDPQHFMRNSNLYIIFDNELNNYRCLEYQTKKTNLNKDLLGYIFYYKKINYHLQQ
ncbi:hypothetical protein ASE40_19415 [Flavobacterium sp. Root935]|nr:hypothetical protein ASE40_19415 [Flavobacterium sp. Root935]